MGKHSQEKHALKKKQQAIKKLQDKLATEIIDVFSAMQRPLDLEEIVDNYQDEARKQEGDRKLLKQYVMMGLGPMVQDGRIKQLDVDADGKHKLELVKE